jgi:hypothetical protein
MTPLGTCIIAKKIIRLTINQSLVHFDDPTQQNLQVKSRLSQSLLLKSTLSMATSLQRLFRPFFVLFPVPEYAHIFASSCFATKTSHSRTSAPAHLGPA